MDRAYLLQYRRRYTIEYTAVNIFGRVGPATSKSDM
jgi:hypothetical protein